jgi:DNA-binding SARP family transcriptional activator
LEVVDADGGRVELGAPRQRAVLAVLLAHANEVVSIDRLIDELWGQTPPNAATSSLQAYVSNLRRALEPRRAPRTPSTVLVTEAPGYVLRVSGDDVDAVRFEHHATAGRRALESGDVGTALESLEAALRLWRGDAFADFAYESFAAMEIARLHERRAAAEEDRVEAMLIASDHVGALAAVGRLVAEYPLRERLRALQIRVLYSAGRQAEALRAFEETRRLLADELGLEPGRELQVLHRQVLNHDVALEGIRPVARARREEERPPPASHGSGSSFVGRIAALRRVEAVVEGALGGRSSLVLIEGEPGIGKTRLMTEVAARVREQGMRVCWGRCHDDEGAPPLWPWVQVLRELRRGDDGLPDHLRSILAALLPELGSPPDDDLAADAARFRLFDGVREAIEQSAMQSPVMIVIDDAHWADASSLRLLRFLSVELRDVPAVAVVAFRNTEPTATPAFADTLAEMSRRAGVDRLPLSGLSQRDVADLLRQTTDLAGPEVDGIALRLQQRTNGNPFFVTELIRLMQSEHRLESADVAETAGDVPLAVADVIRRRIARLPDDVQTVLGVAAVIGRTFDLGVLAHACGLDVERTLEVLEVALATRIAVADEPGRYRFTHALVTETLYADLAPARRVRLHARVASAIETMWIADLEPHYNELVHHYGRAPAALSEHALRYARLAAEQATRRLAYDEAATQWMVALDALERGGYATPITRARLLLELANAEQCAGNLARATTAHDEALAAAQRSGDVALLAEVALAYGEIGLWQVRRYGVVDEPVVHAITDALQRFDAGDSVFRAQLLTGLAMAIYYRDGERERCRSLAREAVSMARRLGDTALLATSLVEFIMMLDSTPDSTEQLDAASELAALETSGLPRETASSVPMRLARLALAHGNASTLERDVDAVARRAAAARHPDEQLWTTWAQTTIAFLQDRLEDAERLAGEAFRLHERLGIWGAHESYATHMVFIWREQGRLAEVAPMIEPLLASSIHPSASKLRGIFVVERGAAHEIEALLGPDPIPRSRDFTWLTDACLTAELAAAADLPCRAELYDLLQPFGDRVVTMEASFLCLGAVAYYLGQLAASLGRSDDAQVQFERAVAINDAIGARPWSRRARARLDAPAVTAGSC